MWLCRFGGSWSDRSDSPSSRHGGGGGTMAVDLSKNGAALLAAYKDVVDGKKDTNWCLFTYEGNSNIIRVCGTGDGGLEELQEELNSGKLMFAFCRVQDPNSGLPKYVLINWIGEGVKDSRKGMCANHLSSIASFLKGAHVTINARDEQDVEPELILSKVSKASGANFSYHQRDEAFRDTPREPVGSVYRKTNAVDEIQQTKKDDFWAQTQRDEELCRREEKKRTQEEKLKVEKERKEVEEKQMKELERRTKERAAQIEMERRELKQREEEERKKEEDRQLQEVQNERTEKRWRQEAKEAKALIGQRSFNPRDVFEQRGQRERSSAAAPSPGKLQSPFLSQSSWTASTVVTPQPTGSPTVSPVQPPENLYTAEEEQEVQEEQEWSDEFDDDAADAPSAQDGLYDTLPQPITSQDGLYNTLPQPITSQDGLYDMLPQPITSDYGDHGNHFDQDDHFERADNGDLFDWDNHGDQGHGDQGHGDDHFDRANHGDHGDRGICARAAYDYQAADDTEITFDPDDIITNIDMLDEGWWRGYGPDGHYGMFPANYVELLETAASKD